MSQARPPRSTDEILAKAVDVDGAEDRLTALVNEKVGEVTEVVTKAQEAATKAHGELLTQLASLTEVVKTMQLMHQLTIKVEGSASSTTTPTTPVTPTEPTTPTVPVDPVKPVEEKPTDPLVIIPPVVYPIPAVPNPVNGKIQATGLFGVNLSGGEFGSGKFPGIYDKDYTYCKGKHFNAWMEQGINNFRVPLRIERLWNDATSKVVNEYDEASKKEIPVTRKDWAAQMKLGFAAGVKDTLLFMLNQAKGSNTRIVWDLHNYGEYGFGGKTETIGKQIPIEAMAVLAGLFAKEFGDHPSFGGFDLMNEPKLTKEIWYPCAQGMVNEFRKYNQTVKLYVEGVNWSGAHSAIKSNGDFNIIDPAKNMVISLHQYFDADSSGDYKVPYRDEVAKVTGDVTMVGVNRIKPAVEFYRAKGYDVHIGEYSAPGRSNPAEDIVKYMAIMDKTMAYLRDAKVESHMWGAGDWWKADYNLKVELAYMATPASPHIPLLRKYNAPVQQAIPTK